MKKFRSNLIALAFVSLGVTTLAGCNKPAPGDPWYVISERAMNNFLDKIQAGGYYFKGGELTTAVHDESLVTWFFDETSSYTDHVCVTVNEETFYALIDDDAHKLANMVFLDKKSAMDLSSDVLPTTWLSKEVSGGNIWEIFINDNPNNPLHYKARASLAFNSTICVFCDFGDFIAPTISNIEFEFDKEDMSTATLKFEYSPTAGVTNEGQVVFTFGETVPTSDIVNEWVTNPSRTYPKAIGEYGSWPNLEPYTFQMAIHGLYDEQLGVDYDPLPYDNFFSYATMYNTNSMYDGYIEIHDYHATETEFHQYISTLQTNGYQMAVGKQGDLVFRSGTLRSREGYELFSDITVKMNDGLVISATRYYTSTTYSGRDAINTHIDDASSKFVILQDSDKVTSWSGEDSPFRAFEDLGLMFDFNIYMHVYLKFAKKADLDEYANTYFTSVLAANYKYNPNDGTYTLSDVTSRTVIKLADDSTNILEIVYYNERRVSTAIAFPDVQNGGYPALSNPELVESIIELKWYEKCMFNLDFTHFYWMTFEFASHEDKMTFVNTYIQALKDLDFQAAQAAERTIRYKKSDMKYVDFEYGATSGTRLDLWFAIE